MRLNAKLLRGRSIPNASSLWVMSPGGLFVNAEEDRKGDYQYTAVTENLYQPPFDVKYAWEWEKGTLCIIPPESARVHTVCVQARPIINVQPMRGDLVIRPDYGVMQEYGT